MGVPRTYGNPLLDSLHRALLEEAIERAEIEIERKLRAAVLLAADRHHTEVARELGVSPADVKAMIQDLERVATDLGWATSRRRLRSARYSA